MVEKTHLKYLAVFIICLILTIPIYSAHVMAASIDVRVYGVHGSEEFEGYVQRESDELIFVADAIISSEEPVDETKIELMGGFKGDGWEFHSCQPGIAPYSRRCFMEDVSFEKVYDICDMDTVPPPFWVILYDKNDQEVARDDQVWIYCDDEAPILDSLSVSGGHSGPGGLRMFGSDEEVTFDYVIIDTACDDCESTQCVGFKVIEIDGPGYDEPIELNMEPDSWCTGYSSHIDIPASEFRDGEVTVNFKVYDNFDQSDSNSEGSVTFIVDESYPDIDDFSIVRSDTGKELEYIIGNVNVDINVTITDEDAGVDTSSVRGDFSKIGGSSSKKPDECIEVDTNSYECIWENIDAEFTDISHVVIIKAADEVGLETEETFSISLKQDTKAPKLDGKVSITCRETDCMGQEIKEIYIYGDENVRVEANFTDSETQVVASVTANLNELNDGYGLRTTSCTPIDDIIRCRWDITLDLEEGGSKSIPFEVRDIIGNTDEDLDGTYTFPSDQVDHSGPRVTDMWTNDGPVNDINYLRARDNFIYVKFEDDGIGIQKNETYIDLSDIGGSHKYEAEGCEERSGGWLCTFKDINALSALQGTPKTVKVHPDSKDDLGNELEFEDEEEIEMTVIVDRTPPQIKQPDTDHVLYKSNHFSGHFVKDYGISVIINVTEEISEELEGIADLGNLVYGKPFDMSCTKVEDDMFTCELYETVTFPGPQEDVLIKFNFTDSAGNPSSTLRKFVDVYEERGVSIDFFNLTMDYSTILPLDRNVLKHYPLSYYPLIINIFLELNESKGCQDVDILNPHMVGSCSSGTYVSLYPSENVGDYSGIIQFALNEPPAYAELDSDYVAIGENDDCELRFNVVCSDEIYSEEEIELVKFNVPLVQQTLMPDQAFVDELNDITEQATEKWIALVNKLQDIFDILNTMCTVNTAINRARQLIAMVRIILGGCADTVIARFACAGAQAAAGGLDMSLGTFLDVILSVTGRVCAFVTCECPEASTEGKMSFLGEFRGCVNLGDQEWTGLESLKYLPAYSCKLLREGIHYSWLLALDGSGFANAIGQERYEKFTENIHALGQQSNLEISKRSWPIAMMCACIPGLIYNLEKLAQLNCKKALCYKTLVPAGLPPEECDKQFYYERCVYLGFFPGVLDLIFNDVFLRNILDNLINTISEQWPSMLWGLGKKTLEKACNKVCQATCAAGTCAAGCALNCGGYAFMTLVEDMLYLGMITEDLIEKIENDPAPDWCDVLREQE